MNSLTRRAALLLAASLAIASPTHAQIGRLKQKVQQKAAGTQAPPPQSSAAGAARVTAVIEWTVDRANVPSEMLEVSWTSGMRRNYGMSNSSLGEDVYTPATIVEKERGSVTLAMDVDPDDLPGNAMVKMAGGRLGLGLSQGQLILSGSRVVSLTGSVSVDRTLTPVGRCDRNARVSNSMPQDPPTGSMSGKRTYGTTDTDVGLTFMDDKPIGFGVGRFGASYPGVLLAGRGSYGCGGTFTARDTEGGNPIGIGIFVQEGPGWVIKAEPTATGYVVTVRGENNSSGWRETTTAKLTWTAPKAPQRQIAGGAGVPDVSRETKFEAGKGSITFTQAGKQATWPLSSQTNQSMPGGGSSVTMMYTPDGGTPSEEKGVLALSIANVMGQTMVGFNLTKGPAGDAAFEAEQCSARSTTTAGKTQGSGECKDGGNVVRFTYSTSRAP